MRKRPWVHQIPNRQDQRLRRHGDDDHLLDDIAEQVLDRCPRLGDQSTECQGALERIGLGQRHERLAAEDLQGPETGKSWKQVERVLAAIEASVIRHIGHREQGGAARQGLGERRQTVRLGQFGQPIGARRGGGERAGGHDFIGVRNECAQAPGQVHRRPVGIIGQPAVPLQFIDPRGYPVERVEQRIGHRRVQRDHARADRAKQVLAGMQQAGEARHVEQAGRSLQRVDGAEHLIDQRLVRRIAFKLQQAGGGVFQVFPRFRDEAFQQRRHRIAVPASSRAISSRSFGRTGFVM